MKISKGTKSLNEFLPLLKNAFHKNFPSLLPKLYTDNTYLENHYLARDDNGGLIGVVASIPNKFLIGNKTLITRGIGMVGVKKSARGQGTMNALMCRAVEDARKDNVDYMYLSGNRKRYERYGFVPCNYMSAFMIIKENIEHSNCSIQLTFEKYNKDTHLETITELYNRQYARYERLDMHKTITSWNNKRISIIKMNNKIIGYCIVKKFTVIELVIDGVDAKDFAINYFKSFCKIPLLYIQTYDVKHIKSLADIAQSAKTVDDCSICVLNYWNTIEALLSAYPCGYNYEYVLEIENYGKKLIKEKDRIITLSDTDESAACCLPADRATIALFSPAVAYSYNLPFTLKLSVSHNDNV